MKSITASAEHHYDRLLDQQADEDELQAYLEKRGITWANYEKECRDAQLDAAADAAFWMDQA